MNKAIKSKNNFYNKVLPHARFFCMSISHYLRFVRDLEQGKRLKALAAKHGTFFDWENKSHLAGRIYLVPMYTKVKGKRVSLKASRSISKEQFDNEQI